MNRADLQQALRAVEPAAVLISPRVLENIIRQTGNFSGLMWWVPHRKSFIVDRQTLFRHVDQEELALKPDQLLPMTVLLLAWEESEEPREDDNGAKLLKCWQRLFHISVHLTFEKLWEEGKLTADGIRDRIAWLGPARFEEIRAVLVQDHYLGTEPDERAVYIEFAAVFLELEFFAPHLLPIFFPIIRDLDEVKTLLSQDVDGREVYQRTRLAGASDPPNAYPRARPTGSSQEAHEYYWRLVRTSERATLDGNVVLAAIQRQRAARVAPTALGYTTRKEAIAGLLGLVDRLQKPLALSPAEMEEWRKHLPTLLDKADQGSHPVEAALLYDLQQVCLDHEREIYALDLTEWLLSGGKRPIKRPLPSQRLVRVTRGLRSAAQRLPMARLSDEDRDQFATLLQDAVRRSEDQVRQRFRPLLTSALQDVGLKPRHPLEATAFHKVVEELLDRIIASGFVTFSELRDTLSRSSLKLPDLTDPHDFIRGDPLLRLDRRLATLLDGVYRRSEIYLRWLERFTALNFGTRLGRLLTMFVTVPFLGAFLIMEMIAIAQHYLGFPQLLDEVRYGAGAALGFFLVGLLHSLTVRHYTAQISAAMGRPLRAFLIDGPLWLFTHPSLKEVVVSWPFQLCYWYMLKPLFLATLVLVFLPAKHQTFFGAGLVFLAAMFFINSRPGQAAGEAVVHVLTRLMEQLRAGLVPGMVDFVARLFKQILHLGDALMFKVDEWLRFRGGDSRPVMIARSVLSLLWFPVAYVIRFNVVVFIEPWFNPLKLPIVTVVTKIMAPMLVFLSKWLPEQLNPVLGTVLGNALSVWLWFWLPDAVTFVIWEMKENWSLYRANRRPALQPVALGRYGETMRSLLLPGFHSGTVPKVYARLREAERLAPRVGSWTSVRSCRSALTEVQDAVQLFVTREFCDLLGKAPAWQGLPPSVGPVTLATNQVRIELIHPDYPDLPMSLEFENRDGALLACLAVPGWLEKLPDRQQVHVHNALIILWKLAGVDCVEHQAGPEPLGPITWDQCVSCWQADSISSPPRLLGDGLILFSPRTGLAPLGSVSTNGSETANGNLNHAANIPAAKHP